MGFRYGNKLGVRGWRKKVVKGKICGYLGTREWARLPKVLCSVSGSSRAGVRLGNYNWRNRKREGLVSGQEEMGC